MTTQNGSECYGNHRFYVAEVVGSEPDGKVFVLIICTACGEFRHFELDLKNKGLPIRLLLEEKRKKEKQGEAT